MHGYPVYLSLESLRILVVGAGRVGERKVASLLAAGATNILVFDPALSEERRREIGKAPGVRIVSRALAEDDLAGASLVFAATDDLVENTRIAALCMERGILCNVAAPRGAGTVYIPSLAGTQGLMAAFSSGGNSPALVKRIREEAQVWLETRYGPLLVFMKRLRPLVLALGLPVDENSALFRSVVYSAMDQALMRNDGVTAREMARTLLPPSLHDRIEELLHGLC